MRVIECVAFFSRLFFLVSDVRPGPWRLAEFQVGGRVVASAAGAPVAMVPVSADKVNNAAVFCLSLFDAGIGMLNTDAITCAFENNEGIAASYAGPVGSIVEPGKPRRQIDQLLRLPEVASLLPSIVQDFLTSNAPRTPEPPTSFSLDARVAGNGAEVIDGWLINVAHEDVALVTGDLRSAAIRTDFQLVERRDVTEHLVAQGATLRGGHFHGFSAVMPRLGTVAQPLFFIIRAGEGFRFMGPMNQPLEHNPMKAVQFVVDRGSMSLPDMVQKTGRTLMLVAGQEEPNRPQPVIGKLLGPRDVPDISLVICHYGSTFWFRAGLQMQRGFPAGIEVIHVCDDPALARAMREELEVQADNITCPTRFVDAGANLGYAGANNLGVGVARAPVVILVNSDVWLDNPLALFEAADWLIDNPQDVVGFQLHFDDGTIQHRGIDIVREASLGGLYIARHPGKGLPASPDSADEDREMIDVDAITGALLAMRRDTYLALGGLDETFAWADFEDVDLCLRARLAGGNIKLMLAGGLYHLEGQSTREGAARARRAAATLINALRFNDRWATHLDARVTGRKMPQRPVPPRPSLAFPSIPGRT